MNAPAGIGGILGSCDRPLEHQRDLVPVNLDHMADESPPLRREEPLRARLKRTSAAIGTYVGRDASGEETADQWSRPREQEQGRLYKELPER